MRRGIWYIWAGKRGSVEFLAGKSIKRYINFKGTGNQSDQKKKFVTKIFGVIGIEQSMF